MIMFGQKNIKEQMKNIWGKSFTIQYFFEEKMCARGNAITMACCLQIANKGWCDTAGDDDCCDWNSDDDDDLDDDDGYDDDDGE